MLLVIAKNQSDANTVSDIFNYMGVISYGTTPELAANELSNRHSAVMFIHPENINSIRELVEIAKTYSLSSSVFDISDGCDMDPKLYSSCDMVLDDSALSSNILYNIIDYQNKRGMSPLGTYRLAGIDASITNASASYFDTPLELTRIESMILKFLIVSYPIKKSARDILKYAFRSGKISEPSSIRAHICSINSKFNALFGTRPIMSERGVGYYVCSGEAK